LKVFYKSCLGVKPSGCVRSMPAFTKMAIKGILYFLQDLHPQILNEFSALFTCTAHDCLPQDCFLACIDRFNCSRVFGFACFRKSMHARVFIHGEFALLFGGQKIGRIQAAMDSGNGMCAQQSGFRTPASSALKLGGLMEPIDIV
jgi:hypothetical protein